MSQVSQRKRDRYSHKFSSSLSELIDTRDKKRRGGMRTRFSPKTQFLLKKQTPLKIDEKKINHNTESSAPG